MSLFSSSWTTLSSPIAWALLHFLWQGLLVAAAYAAARALTRPQQTSLRYALACGALLTMLALPIVTAILLVAPTTVSADSKGGDSPLVTTAAALTQAAAAVSAEQRGQPPLPTTPLPPVSWIVLIWLIGVAALSIYHLGGWRAVERLRRRGAGPVSADWTTTLERLCGELGIRRSVALLESAWVKVPTVIGWLEPVILLPTCALTGLSRAQLEALLAHELAHVRRHDYLMNLVQTAIETLLFYHPAVWWISRQIRQEREHCCDDVAVAICGDRRTYAGALATMETLRSTTPNLAVAADGGSLLSRIRRLAAMSPRDPTEERPSSAWLAGATVLGLILGIATALNTLAPGDAHAVPRGDDANAEAILEGRWQGELQDDQIRLELRPRIDGGSWQMSTWMPRTAVTGTFGQDASFTLQRDAGTVFFSGSLAEDRRGSGTFRFVADAAYVAEMEARGYRFDHPRELFQLAYFDVSRTFLTELESLGYADLPLERLLEMRIHDVSPEYIRRLTDLGLDKPDAERLVEMRIHDVTPRYVEEMQGLGIGTLSWQRLVEMRIHDVTPEFARGLAAQGIADLDAKHLVEMRIHDVDPELVRELLALGFEDLGPRRLMEMSIHNVTPDYVRQMEATGLTDLTSRRLVEMRIHDVTPEAVAELEAASLRDLSVERLMEMRIHDVTPRFVAELEAAGLSDIDPRRLVEMRIHDVTPSFVREMQALGIADLTPARLVEMRIHDVTPEFVRTAQARGYSDLTAARLVEMRIHDRFE